MPHSHIREDLFRRAVATRRKVVQPSLNGGNIRGEFLRVVIRNRFHSLKQNRFVYQRQQKRFRVLTALRRNLAQLFLLTGGDF